MSLSISVLLRHDQRSSIVVHTITLQKKQDSVRRCLDTYSSLQTLEQWRTLIAGGPLPRPYFNKRCFIHDSDMAFILPS
jgi:hypothetical protein